MTIDLFRLILLGFTLCFSISWAQAEVASEITYPSVKLRGYGTLSGKWHETEIKGPQSSVLDIECESEEKAQLVQAKYISDLQSLPGVKAVQIEGKEGPLTGYQFGQGMILAGRDGKRVSIVTWSAGGDLPTTEKNLLASGNMTFSTTTKVPMFLDRFDRYGFRFYYSPLATPEGKSLDNYDKGTELDWSQKNQTGIQVWDPACEQDEADGFTDRNEWQWVADATRTRNLALGINLSSQNQSWLEKWYPEEMAQKMPGFIGSYYNGPLAAEDGNRFISWNSSIAEDSQLSALQQDVHRLKTYPNLTSWLEPHGEMGHGDSDFLMEYGPVADKTYREWLKDKYKTLEVVSQRWTGKPDTLKSWDDVHVPDMASFCGWSPDVVDLAGPWRVDYPQGASTDGQPVALPAKEFMADFDDTKWPVVTAPGDDQAMFGPRFKPAVFRKNFLVDAAWLKAHPKVWLYVFDLNRSRDQFVTATLNSKEVGRSKIWDPTIHRDWFEVTGVLNAGANTLALGLPNGYIGYKIYLSGTEPRYYPDLDAQLNAGWEDFAEWASWSRVQKVERGLEMIRQEDPDRGIMMMQPGPFFGGEQTLAQKYGGDFHDTGGMAAWWNDFTPSLMAAVGMPMSVEPSQPAHKVSELRDSLGKWSTQGIQAIDYFLQIGDIFWNDELRADFEDNLQQWKFFGKYHVPPSFATFYSGRVAALTTFPWNRSDLNVLPPTGFPRWGWSSDIYPRPQGVTEDMFLNGGVNKFPVIIDSNSSILDQEMIDAIGNYVKQGGIFVTYVQTGRHSPTQEDAWPISALTGYSVTSISPYKEGNDLEDGQPVQLAPNETVYSPDKWDDKISGGGSGLSLKKVAPECQDLVLWKDGTVAVGMRPLGKGYIFHVGVKYDSVGWGETQGISQIFNGILAWAKLPKEPAGLENIALAPSVTQVDANTRGLYFRHYLSNNGLYDVWTVWNSNSQPLVADLVFRDISPTSAIRIKTGEVKQLEKNADGKPVLKLALDPLQTENFITPRGQLEMASKNWFELQRQWWQGTTPPSTKALPSIASLQKNVLPLNNDWTFKRLDDTDDPAPMALADFDDKAWDKRDFTSALVPLITDEHAMGHHAMFRKTFTVPKNWDKGPVVLWISPSEGDSLMPSGQVYCDGSLIQPWGRVINGNAFDGLFKPGTTHTIAIELRGKGCILGNIGNAWLYYRADPVAEIDLAGTWESSDDGITFDKQMSLPGAWDAYLARAVINIPADHAKQTVLFHADVEGRMSGVIINGRWVSRSHVQNDPQFDINLTPWIKFGQDNKLVIVNPGKGTGTVKSFALDFYDPGTYP